MSSILHPKKSISAPLVLAVVALSSFLATFNETFLNVALTPIMFDYQLNEASVQWVVTAYMLVAAVMVPLTGFYYRRFPTKPLLLSALGFLFLGSLIGWLAPNFLVVICGRALQAVGTGMIVPIGMNLTLAVSPRSKLGTYMGVVSAMTTLGPAFGPIAAGGIMQLSNWHTLFMVFGIAVLLVMVFATSVVENVSDLGEAKLDLLSTVSVSLGLLCLMYGISTLFGGKGILGGIFAFLGLLALIVFVLRQMRCAHPLLNLAPFSEKGFNLGLALVILALMTVFSMNMVLPVFMQSALGFSPLQAALTLLPACLVACVLAPIVGKIFDRHGLKFLAPLGMALISVCVLGLSFSHGNTTYLGLLAWYAPTIAGCAMVMGPAQSFALSQMTPKLHSHGTTIMGTSFQLAGCIGSSLFMGVYSLAAMKQSNIGANPQFAAVTGFKTACWVAFVLNLIGFLVALMLSRFEQNKIREQAGHLHLHSGNIQAIPTDATAAAVMNQQVYAARDTDSAYRVLQLLVKHKTSGLPVLDAQNQLVGFVTDGAILRALSSEIQDSINMSYVFALWAQGKDMETRLLELQEIPITDLAYRRVVSVDAQASLQEVCEVLSNHQIKKVPVLASGKVVGVIARTSLLRAMLRSQSQMKTT